MGAPAEPESLTPDQKKLASLKAKHQKLQATLTDLQIKREILLQELSPKPYAPSTQAHTINPPPLDQSQIRKDADKQIKEHIKLLHDYNEIKDVAQGLIGMIADARKERVKDVQGEFGVGDGD